MGLVSMYLYSCKLTYVEYMHILNINTMHVIM